MFEYRDILEKRKVYLVGNQNNPKGIVEHFNKESEVLLDELNEIIYKDGYLKYVDNIVVIKELYGKLLILAKSYKMNGTQYFNDKKILKIIVDGLELFKEHFYNKNLKEHTNWWQWEIGIPLILNNIFSLLYDEIDFKIIQENLDTTSYFQPDPRYSGNNPVAIHPSGNPLRLSSGGNRTDTVKISFLRGVILSDEKEIISALEALEDVWEYIDGTDKTDGFYKDGSFIQHGSIPYAGGYGEVLLTGLAEIFYLLKDSSFAKYIKGQDRLYDIIFNSFAPFFFNGRFSDMLSGRGIVRENNDAGVIGHRILNDILLIAGIFQEDKRKDVEDFVINEIVKYGREKYLQEEKSPFMYEILSELLMGDIEEKEYVSQVVVCNRMNRIVKRTQNYAIGIAMHSYNVGNYEAMNGENIQGWYTGDGAYYLYDQDREADRDYWKNLDMYYIPGTTETTLDMCGVDAQRNIETSFISNREVGGVALKEYGIGVMKFTNWNESLKSRKSWCFLKGKIVFIEDNFESDREFYTTLFNRKYSTLPKIIIDDVEFLDKSITKKVKTIIVDNWKISFLKDEEINIEIENKKEHYFIKIWKSVFEKRDDGKFIWELISLKDKEEDEYKLLLKEDEYILETDSHIFKVDWESSEICTLEDKKESVDRKLKIE